MSLFDREHARGAFGETRRKTWQKSGAARRWRQRLIDADANVARHPPKDARESLGAALAASKRVSV